MSNWTIELSHPKWELQALERGLRAWLSFNHSLFGPVAIQVVQHLGNEVQLARSLKALRAEIKALDYLAEGVRLSLKITQAASQLRLHLVFNEASVPAAHWPLLEHQLWAFYQDPALKLTPVDFKELPVKAKTNEYWTAQANTLPAAPQLNKEPSVTPTPYHYRHDYGYLLDSEYQDLKTLANQHHLSLTVVLLLTMTDLLQAKTASPWFRTNLTLLNRLPIYPHQNDRASYATTLACLPLETQDGASFLERAKNVDRQLRSDTVHLDRPALPALNKAEAQDQGDQPFTFTCQLEQDLDSPTGAFYAEPFDVLDCDGVTPRTHLMIDMWEIGGQLHYRWSYVEPPLAEPKVHPLFKRFNSQIKTLVATAAVIVAAGVAEKAAASSNSFNLPSFNLPSGSKNNTPSPTQWSASTQSPTLIAEAKQPILAQQKLTPQTPAAAIQAPRPLSQLHDKAASTASSNTPLGKMQAAMQAMAKTDLNPIHHPDKAVPPVPASAVQSKTPGQIQELHEEREEKLVDEHYKDSPAIENYNTTVIQFSEFLEHSAPHCLQDPYYKDVKKIDDLMAEICGLTLAGRVEEAQKKIDEVQQRMKSLEATLTKNPLPAMPDNPLLGPMHQLEGQADNLDKGMTACIMDKASHNPVANTLKSFDAGVKALDIKAKLDMAKVHREDLLNRKGKLAHSLREKQKEAMDQAMGVAPTEEMKARQAEFAAKQKELEEKQAFILGKYNDAKGQYDKYNAITCQQLQTEAGKKASQMVLNQYGAELKALLGDFPIDLTHAKITQLASDAKKLEDFYNGGAEAAARQMAEDKVKDLAAIAKAEAEKRMRESQEMALINNLAGSAQGFNKDAKSKFCDKDLGSIPAGKCRPSIPYMDVYPTAKAHLLGLQQKLQSIGNEKYSLAMSMQTQAAQKLAEAETASANANNPEYHAAQKEKNKQAAKDKATGLKDAALTEAQNRAMTAGQAVVGQSETYQSADAAYQAAQQAKQDADSAVAFAKETKNKIEMLNKRLDEVYKNLDSLSPADSAGNLQGQLATSAKNISFANAKNLAGQQLLDQRKNLEGKLRGCGVSDMSIESMFARASIPSKDEMIARFKPPTPQELHKRLKEEALSKMMNATSMAKGQAQTQLNNIANETTAAGACLAEHAKDLNTHSMEVVQAGGSATCAQGMNSPKLLSTNPMAPNNDGLTILTMGGWAFANPTPFGGCRNPNPTHPEVIADKAAGVPTRPFYTCLMQPKGMTEFVNTSETLTDNIPMLQKKSTASCPFATSPQPIKIASPGPGPKIEMP
jgi:hypothetical protein